MASHVLQRRRLLRLRTVRGTARRPSRFSGCHKRDTFTGGRQSAKHDLCGMRFSRLSQIDRANVQKLQRVWTYHTGETNWSSFSGPQHIQSFETTPLMVDGVVYFTTPPAGLSRWTQKRGRRYGYSIP